MEWILSQVGCRLLAKNRQGQRVVEYDGFIQQLMSGPEFGNLKSSSTWNTRINNVFL
ncbi:hypothetical protein ALO42_101876 [Pseudomonas syringae pv. atrofaciens]|nr:hypothetical protein ALO42_101876 [Pseudomonas syringae pv. atrofaciens]RMN69200.1 hypothetical protein ALQ54_101176 [Pseudomonas syringae]